MKIALLGAESTGKSQLAHALAAHLRQAGHDAIAVDEYLRQWCKQQARTPQAREQNFVALEQQNRIETAARTHDWVIADTTPLMTAVYSEFIFADVSLYPAALGYQHSFDLTLVTGLDIPWQADGMQRDGPHVRAPVDTLLRLALHKAKISYEVIYGQGEQRLQNALRALQRDPSGTPIATKSIASNAYLARDRGQKGLKKWQWSCEKCSDPDCEHRLFQSLLGERSKL